MRGPLDGAMHRPNVSLVLFVALAACGSGGQPASLSVHSRATIRRCTTPLELRGEGHALSGIRGEFHEYPAAKVFSDDRIQVEWVVVRGVLNARVTNRASGVATVEPVMIGNVDRAAGIHGVRVAPNTFEDVEVISVGEIEIFFSGASGNEAAEQGGNLLVELAVRLGEKECRYNFRLAPAAV